MTAKDRDSLTVRPLHPSFTGRRFVMEAAHAVHGMRKLIFSFADGKKIERLFGGSPAGCALDLQFLDDGRVRLVRSVQ
jgi:hypothetical protein